MSNKCLCVSCGGWFKRQGMAKDGVTCRDCKEQKANDHYYGVSIKSVGDGEMILPLNNLKKDLLKQDNNLYLEKVYNRADLMSAMDALDRLGKEYKVRKLNQQGNAIKNIPSFYWEIKEENSNGTKTFLL
ncbi:hypothetical protein RE628_11430 [Paenibacillus sp. D2_2]|uniref:hypothetical protein n=1 Tax=Paenibacillus sp. D2_2 TaxID=3073092 RepID=UPI002814A4D5|nr:hypothetical protein [Paenibacillus sp. D2_2]WMT42839.1 hypothetical protein RE628_11430 [Paenibacillus sp. D2_2]